MAGFRSNPPEVKLSNMRQIYRRTPMAKCDFNKGALYIFRRTASEALKLVFSVVV